MTPRQLEVLSYLRAREATGLVPPSFAEIAARIGVASKSTVIRLLRGLEEQGKITRRLGRARAIEIVQGAEYQRGWREGYNAALRDLREQAASAQRLADLESGAAADASHLLTLGA